MNIDRKIKEKKREENKIIFRIIVFLEELKLWLNDFHNLLIV